MACAKGFTLIELMVVVAIVGILATVAMPAYQDYAIRSRLTELILYSSKCKNVIEEASQVRLPLVRSGNDWGCSENSGPFLSQYVHSVTTSPAGVISVLAYNIRPVDVDGQAIVLTPYADPGLTTAMTASDYLKTANVYVRGWRCTFTGNARYVPASCR